MLMNNANHITNSERGISCSQKSDKDLLVQLSINRTRNESITQQTISPVVLDYSIKNEDSQSSTSYLLGRRDIHLVWCFFTQRLCSTLAYRNIFAPLTSTLFFYSIGNDESQTDKLRFGTADNNRTVREGKIQNDDIHVYPKRSTKSDVANTVYDNIIFAYVGVKQNKKTVLKNIWSGWRCDTLPIEELTKVIIAKNVKEMAKSKRNIVTHGLSGKLGDMLVFRQVGGETIVSSVAEPSKKVSEKQIEHRKKFKHAVVYAKTAIDSPETKEIYEVVAAKKGKRAFVVAVADFFNAPEIEHINVSGYTGQPGDVIIIEVSDDVLVTSVHVSIINADGTVVEEGEAVAETALGYVWKYTATQVNESLEGDKITVSVSDLPHNVVTEEIIKE
jgi:hypothetical protein